MVLDVVKSNVSNYFLNNYSLNLPQDWLTQCLEFINEEYPVSFYFCRGVEIFLFYCNCLYLIE